MKNKRKIIQNAFFGIWLLALIFIWIGKVPTSHQFCPYASVCFGAMLPAGYVAYLPMISLGLLIVVLSIFWGRKFCGYICFWGTLQERLFTLNKRKNKISVPPKLEIFLKLLKYLIFFATLGLAGSLLAYKYMDFCPVLALSFPAQLTLGGGLVLLIIVVGGFFIERFWCRYLCPYAAFMNLFIYLGKILHLKRKVIRVELAECISCTLCDKACPMNIKIIKMSQVSDPNCIYCGNCIEKCPKNGISFK